MDKFKRCVCLTRFFFFSSRRRHTRCLSDWSSDVCSSDLGPADANPDLGDSAITETFGIGGFAMAAAPAIVRFVGGTPADAIALTRLMERITLAKNSAYGLPSLGFSGTPTGIDARRVVEPGIAPVIN